MHLQGPVSDDEHCDHSLPTGFLQTSTCAYSVKAVLTQSKSCLLLTEPKAIDSLGFIGFDLCFDLRHLRLLGLCVEFRTSAVRFPLAGLQQRRHSGRISAVQAAALATPLLPRTTGKHPKVDLGGVLFYSASSSSCSWPLD